jgi:Uma2 family endonuclease
MEKTALMTQVMTPEEFDVFAELPENADKVLEFIHWEIIEKVPSNAYSSKISARVIIRLGGFVEEHDLGHVTGEAGGYQIGDDRYVPDVAFVAKAKQAELDKRGYNHIAPDLVVEVISPSDKPKQVADKIAAYLAAGITVWALYPETKTAQVHRPNQAMLTLDEDGSLSAEDILPGFQLSLKDVFR